MEFGIEDFYFGINVASSIATIIVPCVAHLYDINTDEHIARAKQFIKSIYAKTKRI